MTSPTLVILAAGMGSRYGGLKQTVPVGPGGESIMDYSVFDALRAGFGKVVFVLQRHMEELFHETYGERIGKRVCVEYAFQETDMLPAGFALPEGRTKPWGTAHAVLAAETCVHEPFAVINADDFYGADGFHKLSAHLSSGSHDYAMAGFTLEQTLSEHGSVARGVCQVTDSGYLKSITELTGIAREGNRIVNIDASGQASVLTGQETVSMNMWAFTPAVFAQLNEVFVRFLMQNEASTSAECYLPTSINELIGRGEARVKVLPSTASWFGVTYRADHERVAQSIGRLVSAGEYPARLWA
jgi:NDP-sugar pyrophosphorylase family protein